MRNEELFLLVGKLNYAWTNTESLLIYLLSFIMGTRKEVAIVTFLTLNTSRARLDLIERLLRLQSTDAQARDVLVPVLARMRAAARIRNNYNHSIYSFDENGEIDSTQLMRIADHGNTLRYGKIQTIDAAEMAKIEGAISEIVDINKLILEFVGQHNITY
jgi:hypothetical protein